MKKGKNISTKSADNMVNVIRELIKEELNTREQVVLCQIVNDSETNIYDVYVVPDLDHEIHGIKSELNYPLHTGDYVYVFKINNQFANSFIIHKVQ